jgi:class 3 adenylate cyclase/ABC-type transport system substrate-binding protein/streptogramin lyase
VGTIGTEGGDGGRGTELRTFLIADVRGYTTYTREHGDEAAGELAARFAEAVREVVERNEGFLLELRGDEALVVFVSARQALRAAVAVQRRIEEIGLERGVGIGLDAGEAVAVEGGYRGGALNLAARLCAQAKAGEVLASEAVIHLAAKVDGLSYVDARTLKLKGYDHPVRAVDVVSSDRIPRGFSRRMHRASSRLRADRRIQVGIAIIVVVALAAIVLPPILREDAPEAAGLEPGLAFFDAATAEPTGHIPMEAAAYSFFDEGTFWVRDADNSVYVAVDAATHEVTRRVPVPAGSADAEDGRLYVGDLNAPTVTVIDVASEQIVDEWSVAEDDDDHDLVSFVLVSNGSVWAQHRDEVLRLDLQTGRIEARIPGIGYGGMTEAEDGSIWTASNAGLVQIDPATNDRGVVFPTRGWEFGSVASEAGAIWTSDETKGVVYKVDPDTGDLLDTYEADEGSRYLDAGDGKVWVANQDVGSVTVIDAVTGELETYPMGHLTAAAMVGGGQALVTILPGTTFEDEIASLTGDVAKVLVPGYPYYPLDPALAGYSGNHLQQQLADATCARLLRYPMTPDPGGWRLEPEVAAGMPTLSEDGRTYTFTIAEGFAFSPPSNEPITAETYAYSIERALSPVFGDQAQGQYQIDDIVGMADYRDGAASHIVGIRADGDTLSITLREPSDTFLDRLAFPAFCPVPLGTPIVEGGVGDPTSSGGGVPDLAMSGPFYVSYHLNGELTILKRNPNYPGPRAAVLDAIALREGLDPSIGIGRVDDGSWDLTMNPDPSLEPGAVVDTAWGPASTAAADGDQRYYAVAGQSAAYLALNASRPLFAHARVRRAVALALSRDEAAAAFGDAVAADALVISGLPGAPAGRLFDPAGDQEAAIEAMGSAPGGEAVFVYPPDCSECPALLEMMQARLAPLDITVRGETMDDPYAAYYSGHAGFDMFLTYAWVDFADGASYLHNLDLTPDWLPPGARESVQALDRLTGDRRDEASAALAEGLSVDVVPAVALARFTWPAYFSGRLGCRVFPVFGAGPDLASLCLVDTG